jgi:hypothetical protein
MGAPEQCRKKGATAILRDLVAIAGGAMGVILLSKPFSGGFRAS